ncbi:hypothetical protein [Frigoribacterium sp. NPDC087798]|uniref:hypothetical protein n=1 Tax=Frigoribacterium sp. NPDC087798 TaxID=3363993 RepID=UPI0038100DF1
MTPTPDAGFPGGRQNPTQFPDAFLWAGRYEVSGFRPGMSLTFDRGRVVFWFGSADAAVDRTGVWKPQDRLYLGVSNAGERVISDGEEPPVVELTADSDYETADTPAAFESLLVQVGLAKSIATEAAILKRLTRTGELHDFLQGQVGLISPERLQIFHLVASLIPGAYLTARTLPSAEALDASSRDS